MNDFRFSFWCFFALVVVLPWLLALVLWRRIGRREKAVPAVAASTAALAFVVGAVWWNLVHPTLWPNPPPAEPNPDGSRVWGLYILAGAAGVGCLVCGTIILLVPAAIWERAAPGTLARLLARVKPADRDDSPPA